MNEIPLTLQTAYADLVDRAMSDAFASAFPEEGGGFVAKTVRGRRYWYFQPPAKGGTRKQRYVGPEAPALLDQIEKHKAGRNDQRDRQTIVAMLVRSGHLPRPPAEIGRTVEALAHAGVFRLRGVMVGTVAYQTYAPMLGVRLSAAMLQTGDVDIAQFTSISVAIDEEAPAILDVLKKTDPSFRAIPHLHDARRMTTYEAAKGIRVDFLTPNEGPDTDEPATLPALGTDAQRLRFLDFLIHEPEPAVLLHGAGIYVLVPTPQRYAIHKLIVSRRRLSGAGKSNKDVQQAAALLEVLGRKRPHELRAAWDEAYSRGPKWRKLLGEGLGLVDHRVRDQALKTFGVHRSIIPGLVLEFSAPTGRYNFDRDVVEFLGQASGETVRCAISREAIDDHFNGDGATAEERVRLFRDNRTVLEKMARIKYLNWPVEDPECLLIKTGDVQKLRREIAAD